MSDTSALPVKVQIAFVQLVILDAAHAQTSRKAQPATNSGGKDLGKDAFKKIQDTFGEALER